MDRERIRAGEGEIDLALCWSRFRTGWWKAALFSLSFGVFVFLAMRGIPNYYRSVSVVAPADEDSRRSSALGALSSMGLVMGGATNLEDIEVLLKSSDLTARVFGKNDLWPFLYGDRYDNVSKTVRVGRQDRLLGKVPQSPGPWDAIRASKGCLIVSASRKLGTISISWDSGTPEGSSVIVRRYLDEGRSRLQEEALERAVRNKKFLEEQIARTFDPLTRERFYAIYAQEVEREMMARNREQFGFKIIDNPRVPDRKAGPRRGTAAILATLLSFLAGAVTVACRGGGGRNRAVSGDHRDS